MERLSCSTIPSWVSFLLAICRCQLEKEAHVLCFADRTTNGTGRIQTQNYHGGLDQLRTNKAPHQKIPTLRETIALLMRPENETVYLNIDVKVDNDPVTLFTLINELVVEYDEYETKLAPRLVLDLWHPKYVEPAREILPYLRLAHIGLSPSIARRYFWDACESFSMNFACLVTSDGAQFRDECRRAGKDICVWTVNDRREMIEATKWGAKAILTDRTDDWLALKNEMLNDWDKVAKETSWVFGWTSLKYTFFANVSLSFLSLSPFLESHAGSLFPVPRRFVGIVRVDKHGRIVHRAASVTQDQTE